MVKVRNKLNDQQCVIKRIRLNPADIATNRKILREVNQTISGIDIVKISKLVTDNSDIGPVGYSGQTPCAKNQPLIFDSLLKIMV